MIPTISQVCCLHSPFDHDLEDFAGAGCTSVEVWLTKLEQHLATHSPADTKKLIENRGLTLAAAAYQGITSTPGLHQVPAEWIHCTLLHAIGADHDVLSEESVNGLVEHATERLQHIEPYHVTFGRPEIGTVAVERAGWPGWPHRTVVEQLVTAHREVYGDAHHLSPSRYPHVSLAYAGEGAESIDTQALKLKLSDVWGPADVSVYVQSVDLVAQSHDGKHITWHPITRIPLKDVDLEAD